MYPLHLHHLNLPHHHQLKYLSSLFPLWDTADHLIKLPPTFLAFLFYSHPVWAALPLTTLNITCSTSRCRLMTPFHLPIWHSSPPKYFAVSNFRITPTLFVWNLLPIFKHCSCSIWSLKHTGYPSFLFSAHQPIHLLHLWPTVVQFPLALFRSTPRMVVFVKQVQRKTRTKVLLLIFAIAIFFQFNSHSDILQSPQISKS